MLSGCSNIPSFSISFIANFIRSRIVNGSPINLFIAYTLPAALAPLLPIPLPGFIFFIISISKPQSGSNLSINSNAETVAIFLLISMGRSKPETLLIVNPFWTVFLTIISSPIESSANPRTSKPQATLDTVPGEKTLISFII